MSRSAHRIHRDFGAPVKLLRYAQKKYLVWVALALGMIVGRVALLPVLPIPEPELDDEFSNLLAADTFAHGRLANPTPAHAEFFESPHILVHPAYASKFPPGMGLFMGFGQKLLGHPYWGVVLSGALMIFLFCWGADAWLPPQWTLIAGGLSASLFFIGHYWFESYWGGSLAAGGGALTIGSLGHILRGTPRSARISFGLGALLLFLTRTFEGGLLCGAVLVGLAIQYRSFKPELRRGLRAIALTNLAVLAAAAPLLLWYNVRVSGSATELPYALYMEQYDLSPPLWILQPYSPKEFSSENYRLEREWELNMYNFARSKGLPFTLSLHLAGVLLGAVWLQFLAFGLLLFAVPWARMRGRKKWLVALMTVGLAGLLSEVSHFPHYTAPFTFVLLLLIVAAGRALWYRIGSLRMRGPVFAAMAAICMIPVVVEYVSAFELHRSTDRSRTVRRLESMGGRHLVFVDYVRGWRGFDPNGEWVYNSADLGSSRVIFAHRRSDAENRELLDQYRDRTAWLVRLGPNFGDMSLERYPASTEARTFSR